MFQLRAHYLVLLQLSIGNCFIPAHSKRWSDDLPEIFNWSSIEPSSKLRYVDCYDGLQCARYSVPLDWTDRDNPNEVAIAVARLPAKVDESDLSFGGTIFLNPGGPSGSGIDLLRWSGRGIQEIVDGQRHFEILSFDPRGVKYTTPSTACFDDDAHRDAYLVQTAAVGSVDDSEYSLNVKWSLAKGLGTLCENSDLGFYDDDSNIRQYVTTALVAHDMVDLTDAIEEHRIHATSKSDAKHGAQQPLQGESEIPLLNYWGYSYGTYLGNTYASMFPGRIGRMILDGVVHAPDYTATGWTTNLNDNDKVWDKFFEWCVEAGPKCALYDSDVKSPKQLASKLDYFIDDLMYNPLPIVYNDNVYLYTYFALQAQLHFSSYGPHQVWPLLAAGLSALLQSDPKPLITLVDKLYSVNNNDSDDHPAPSAFLPHLQFYDLFDPFNNHSSPYPPGYPHGLEASTAILCGDGDDITSDTKSSYTSYLSLLKSQSRLIGPVWAQITLWCRGWPASQRPAERNRFTGPWSTKLSQYHRNGSDDGWARPLLFIGNTADPVTPLRNAVAMAKEHEGARVLVQDAPGHCSGVNIPSECTWNAIKAFFNEGEMPEVGKICELDWKPWDRP